VDFSESSVDELQIGIVISGAHSRIVRYANATACEILNRERREVVGHSWRRFVSRPDYELLTIYERRAIGRTPGSGGKAPSLLMRFSRRGGEIVHARVTSTLTDEFMGLFGNDEPHVLTRLEDVTNQEQIASAVRLALDNSPMSLSLVDRSGRVVFSSRGRSPQETDDSICAETSSVFEVFADYPEPLSMLEPAFRGEASSKVIQGYGRYFDFHVVPITDAAGEVRFAAALTSDVTDRELARASQSQLASLAEHALTTLESSDLWQHAVTMLASQLGAAATLYEIATTDHALTLAARAGPSVPSGVADSALSAAVRDGRMTARAPHLAAGWWTLAAPVGRAGACSAVVAAHRRGLDGEPFGDQDEDFLEAVASVLGSAAARFAAERETRHRSMHDALTDLPNRWTLLERLARNLEQQRVGVVFIDLDDFKAVNDTYGHRAGDELLVEIARRLRAVVRPGDLVARLAGDEFAVVCERVDSPAAVERLAERMLAAIGEPVVLAEAAVRISASAGVAVSRPDLTDPERLLNASDIAMYAAKRSGAGRCVVHDSRCTSDRFVPSAAAQEICQEPGRTRSTNATKFRQ
jgi:diguanylate cyclase (GGDEF)-like protein